MRKRTEWETVMCVDVISVILKHLPVKSLMRFKCVSKQWRLLIEDPLFVDSHRACSHKRPGGINIFFLNLTSQRNSFLVKPDSKSFPPGFQARLSDCVSSNYIHLRRLSFAEGLACYNSRIWNPSTREILNLPDPPRGNSNANNESWEAFYPSINVIGFDQFHKNYKVLWFRMSPSGNNKGSSTSVLGWGVHKLEGLNVVTLGTSQWREINCVPQELVGKHIRLYTSLCVNSVIFCFITINETKNQLCAFDTKYEKSRVIHLPKDHEFLSGNWNEMEVCGKCCLMNQKGDVLWTLDYESGEWRKEYIKWPDTYILVDDLASVRGGGSLRVVPVGKIHHKEVLFQKWDNPWKPKYQYYDLRSGKARDVHFPEQHLYEHMHMINLVETAFPLQKYDAGKSS